VRVYLVRHAEAEPGEPDAARRLTAHGRRQAKEVGRRLAREGVRVDAVLSSPLLRARQTAEAIAAEIGATSEPDARLAPGASADGIRAIAADHDGPIVVVGHQPDCGKIAAEISGKAPQAFPTAAICVLAL
jgi:phosphohistidine phosphatase